MTLHLFKYYHFTTGVIICIVALSFLLQKEEQDIKKPLKAKPRLRTNGKCFLLM